MESTPGYVSVLFTLTTFATILIFLSAVPRSARHSFPARLFFYLLPAWMLVQAVLANQHFYLNTSSSPPRLVTTGVLPAVVLIVFYLTMFPEHFVDLLPLRSLTLVHTIRVPVELVLLLLSQSGAIPQLMTFEGRNFDILSGLLSPVAYYFAFSKGRVNRAVLIVYNFVGLALLANIVTIAIMSLPSPIQQLAEERSNEAVLYFPYIWLPTVVVPIVLFAHLASLKKLWSGKLA
jgi:hypothetical protein